MNRWRLKLFLIPVAVLLVLGTIIFNSRVHSKNAVGRYKDQLRAAGEKLSIDELIPPPPDPEKNGLKLFTEACRSLNASASVLDSNMPPEMRPVASGKALVGWRQREVIGFYSPGLITNTWEDIDQALRSQSTALELLRQTAERPQLVFKLDYKSGFTMSLTHLSKMKEMTLLLEPASVDALHHGNSLEAATNIHTLIALVDIWNEPLLISQLVRIGMLQIAVPAQWGFLQATNLSDDQLALLQNDWTKVEFVQSMEKAMETERAWESVTIQQLRTSNSPSATFSAIYGPSPGSSSFGWLNDIKDAAKQKTSDTLWRISWSYSDELAALQGAQVVVEAARRIQTNGYFKDAIAEENRKLAALDKKTGTNWLRNELDDDMLSLGMGSAEGLSHTVDRLSKTEAARRITVTSIALKRYQLRHGAWPADLQSLVPEFLPEIPRDPIDGQPLRYRPNSDGTFLLYSIGSDGTDDGGDPTPTGRGYGWQNGRDWVWPQPATPAEIKHYYENPPK